MRLAKRLQPGAGQRRMITGPLPSPRSSVVRSSAEDRDRSFILSRDVHEAAIRADCDTSGTGVAAIAAVREGLQIGELAVGRFAAEGDDGARSGGDRVHVQAIGGDGDMV